MIGYVHHATPKNMKLANVFALGATVAQQSWAFADHDDEAAGHKPRESVSMKTRVLMSQPLDPDDGEPIIDNGQDSDHTQQHGTMSYGELSCNANAAVDIQSQACLDAALPFSQLVLATAGDDNDVLVVPCGECYTMDYTNGEVITLPSGGMDVLGRLHFPSTSNVMLNT